MVFSLCQPFYMRFCNGVQEKNQHNFIIKDWKISRLLWILLYDNTIRDTSFCGVLTNIYVENFHQHHCKTSCKKVVLGFEPQPFYIGVDESF